jgi:hypothetical protein
MMLPFVIKAIGVFLLWTGWPALAQVNDGELRLRVTDPVGLGLRASVTVSSEANHFCDRLTTNDEGTVTIKTLAHGIYLVKVERRDFSTMQRLVEVRSALDRRYR